MKNFEVVLLMCAFLSACGGEGEARPFNPGPSLRSFDIVDSYGVDTAKSYTTLVLDPYIDNGLFDIFWRVDSLEDYRVNIRLNDVPDTTHSQLIYSTVCGYGHNCDQGGNVICEYTSDLYLSCNNSNHPEDVSAFFKQIPQTLYMVLEVCDLDSPHCEYIYHKVSMQ